MIKLPFPLKSETSAAATTDSLARSRAGWLWSMGLLQELFEEQMGRKKIRQQIKEKGNKLCISLPLSFTELYRFRSHQIIPLWGWAQVGYDHHWLLGWPRLPPPIRWGRIVLAKGFHRLLSPELGGGRQGLTMGWAQQGYCLPATRHSEEIGNLFASQDFCPRVVSTLPWIHISSNSLLLSRRLSKYQHPDNLLVSRVNVSKSLDSTWR